LIFKKLGILFVGKEKYKAKGTPIKRPPSTRVSDLSINLSVANNRR